MEKSKLFGIFSLLFIIGGSLIYTSTAGSTGGNTQSTETINYHSLVVVRKNGEVVHKGHNLFTNEGSDFVAEPISTGNSTNTGSGVDQMGVGTLGSTDASHDSFTGSLTSTSGSNPATISWSKLETVGGGSTQNLSASNEFTSGADGQNVNATYLKCSGCGTGYDYFAEETFNGVTLQSSDKINTSWYVWAS